MTRITKEKFGRAVTLAMVAAMIHQIWKAKNETIWKLKVPRPQLICDKVKQDCKYRFFDILKSGLDIKGR